jgi:hypothetical protein
MKWRWIEKSWGEHYHIWLKTTRLPFIKLVLQCRNTHARTQRPQRRRTIDEDNVLSDREGRATGIEQQLAQYEAEPRHPTVMIKDSPISYWLAQRH